MEGGWDWSDKDIAEDIKTHKDTNESSAGFPKGASETLQAELQGGEEGHSLKNCNQRSQNP